ncbi:MAG: LPP20 family lipoprotein [Thermodesulfobacteriota bacterium]
MLTSKFYMKSFSLFVMLLLLLSLSPCFLFAANGNDLTENLPSGTINWSRGIITATGSGAPPSSVGNPAQARLMAKRAAVLDARRNLLETVKGVTVDAQTTVQNFMTTSDIVVTKVSGIVKLSRVINTRYMSDGAVEVTVEMDLRGDLLKLMLEETGEQKKALAPALIPRKEVPPTIKPPSVETPQTKLPTPPVPSKPLLEAKIQEPPKPPSVETPQTKPVQPPPEPALEVKVKEAKKEDRKEEISGDIDLTKLNYSGLVVDARKLQIRPALIPKIMDQKGELIYSDANLLQKDAVKMGVVGYAKDVDAAKKNQRVTENPFVIKGIQATGQKRTDVVINDRDANIIQGSDKYTNYLKNGRVLLVYD